MPQISVEMTKQRQGMPQMSVEIEIRPSKASGMPQISVELEIRPSQARGVPLISVKIEITKQS